jgi:hypothetical protein
VGDLIRRVDYKAEDEEDEEDDEITSCEGVEQLAFLHSGGLVFKAEVRFDEVVDLHGCAFSRDGRQLVLDCGDSTFRIHSSTDLQLIKMIHLVGDRQDWFNHVGITADGCQVACVEHGSSQTNRHVRRWDVHGDGSALEEVCVCVGANDATEGSDDRRHVSKIAVSPLDDSIVIMTRADVVKLARRRARDMASTVEVVADAKCFDTTG